MSEFISFIKSRRFFIHLGSIVLVLFLFIFVVIRGLSSFTDHGEFVQVPDFKNVEVSNLDEFIKGKELGYEIIDSVYDPRQKPGIVLRQEPEAGSTVKHNRRVYLYVTGMVAPQITMPKLIDRSERQARLILTSYGLRLGKVSTKPWDCNGCVISQLLDGKEVKEGERVKKGSSIDLVLGEKDSFYTPVTDTSRTEDPNFNNEPE